MPRHGSPRRFAYNLHVVLGYLVEAPGRARLVDIARPEPGPEEVLVRVEAVGICGSDIEMVAGARAPAFCRLPVVLGHEWSGRVEAVGDGVDAGLLGRRVAVEGHNYCGACGPCAAGATQRCEQYDEFGFTRHGGYAPYVAARADLCHVMQRAPADVAAVTEPTACALHAVERVGVTGDDTVVVLGAGPIGLLATALSASRGARRIVVCDVRDAARPFAERMGATEVVIAGSDHLSGALAHVLPDGADVVIEAAGQAVTQQIAMLAVRRGGRVALMGLAGARTTPMNLDALVLRDARVEASFAYPSAVFGRAAALIDDGLVDPRPMLTHHLPLSQVEAAFDLLRTRTSPVVKVVLDPQEQESRS